jgi:hypothetical protein
MHFEKDLSDGRDVRTKLSDGALNNLELSRSHLKGEICSIKPN